MIRPWVFSGCLFICSQVAAEPTAKIIGGDNVTPPSPYPWVTSLQYVPFGAEDIFLSSHFCGASLISSQWLMTAAHCVDSGRPDEVAAVIGKININNLSDSDTLSIEQIVVHPGFNQGAQFNNDIALLRLASPVSATPVSVATPADAAAINDGDDVTVIGWGSLVEDDPASSPILQEAQQPFYDSDTCEAIYGVNGDWVTANMVCSGGERGIDACFGDSGGPVVETVGGSYIQHGLVSWGVGCDVPYSIPAFPEISAYPGVNTKVANYASWIDSHINGLSLDSPLDFGDQPAAGSVFTIPAKVINNSASDSFTVTTLQFSPVSPFTVSTTDCLGTTLAPGRECSVSVSMGADSSGLQTSELIINTADGQVLSSEIFANVQGSTPVSGSFADLPGDWFSSGLFAWEYENGSNGERMVSEVSSSGGDGVLLFTADEDGTVSFNWRMDGSSSGFQFLTLLLNDREVRALQFDNAQTESVQVNVDAGDMLTWIIDASNSVTATLTQVAFTAPGQPTPDPDPDPEPEPDNGGSGGGSALFSIWLLAAWWIRRKF